MVLNLSEFVVHVAELCLKMNEDFDKSVQEFYEKLLNNQESLGPDETKVLYDNLWELYARDEQSNK